MKYIQQVSEFMAIMGQEMPTTPTIPSGEIMDLRSSLIAEENCELHEAAMANNIVEVADALCDLRYVVEGAMRAYGFSPELMDELFDEVQRSNMSKICQTKDEAQRTASRYSLQDNIEVKIVPVQNLFTVVRASDSKVLKSINYSEPNLRPILERHGVRC